MASVDMVHVKPHAAVLRKIPSGVPSSDPQPSWTDTDLVAHLTPHGELVIMNKTGVFGHQTQEEVEDLRHPALQRSKPCFYCPWGSRVVRGEPDRVEWFRPQFQTAGGAVDLRPPSTGAGTHPDR